MEAIEHEEHEKELEDEIEDIKEDIKKESEIASLLSSIGYTTREYPNGITLGLDLKAIPGSRGVHVDIVHVLDMRNAKYGRTHLAMQSSVLESINRKVDYYLKDVGLGEMLSSREIVTPHGRREIITLKSTSGKSSALHETRSVYVVYKEGTVGPRDLDWLTDSARIIPANEFSLIQKSDSRSLQQEVKNAIQDGKWKELDAGYRTSWMSILPLIIGIASLMGIAASLLTGSGALILPLIAAVLSIPASLYLYRRADSHFAAFDNSQEIELAKLASIGESARLRKTSALNEEKLQMIGDLNFIITPLMGGAIVAIESRDVDAAVSSLLAIMDECVLHYPLKEEPEGTNKGLKKFLKVFEELGGISEEQRVGLSLAYVGVSGYLQSPLPLSEVLEFATTLSQALFDCGILSSEVKASFDDNLNITGMTEWVRTHPMPEDVPIDPVETKHESELKESGESGIDEDTLAEMAAAGLEHNPDEVGPDAAEFEPDEDSLSSEEVSCPVADSEDEVVLVAETVQTKLSEDGSEAEEPLTGSEIVEKAQSKRKSKSSREPLVRKESEAVKA